MSSEWRASTVGAFCPFKYGKGLPERERLKGIFPVLSSAGVVGTHSKPLFDGSGVVIGRKGTAGSVTFSPGPFWPIDTAFYVEDVPTQRDIRFTYYLLKTLRLETMNSDSAVPGLNRDNAHAVSVAVPPLPEQVEIAAILGALDDRITLLRETNATLEAIAQALFKSWFVDFDPVYAKMEGRAPEGMIDATAALFPDGLEESELGAVPVGWRSIRLDSFVELAYGKALKAELRKPGSVPVYGSGGITGWHDVALVNEASIVVGRKGTVGTLYWESRPFFPIDTVFYVKTKLPMTYCHQLLKTLGLGDMNTDAAVPGLNRENVYRLLAAGAPQKLILAFDSIAHPLRQKIDQNAHQAQTLATLRDTLLPRLISGQLRLPEAQAQIEDFTHV